jgi:hypothetical protein
MTSPKSSDGILAESEDVLTESTTGQILKLASGHNTIDDKAFFEHLPTLLAQVSEKVAKLMQIEDESLVNLSTMEAVAPAPEEEPLGDEKESSETADAGAAADGDVQDGDAADASVAQSAGIAASPNEENAPANEKKGEAEAAFGGSANGVADKVSANEEESKRNSAWEGEGGAGNEHVQNVVEAGEATAQDGAAKDSGVTGTGSSEGRPSAPAAHAAEEARSADAMQGSTGEVSTAAAEKPAGAHHAIDSAALCVLGVRGGRGVSSMGTLSPLIRRYATLGTHLWHAGSQQNCSLHLSTVPDCY